MFEKMYIGSTIYSKSKDISLDFHWEKFSNYKQVEHDGDTSNFDFFAEDDAPEAEDDLTGWDKEF